jgi:hypothetical protein
VLLHHWLDWSTLLDQLVSRFSFKHSIAHHCRNNGLDRIDRLNINIMNILTEIIIVSQD